MAKPPPKGQSTIPVPSEIGFAYTPDELYERKYGREKREEQEALYIQVRACTCASEHPNRWGRGFHKPPCPRAGRRF